MPKTTSALAEPEGAILEVSYAFTMRDASHLRTKGYAPTRCGAIEMAFDFSLGKGTTNGWQRTGEVFVDRKDKRMMAWCVKCP